MSSDALSEGSRGRYWARERGAADVFWAAVPAQRSCAHDDVALSRRPPNLIETGGVNVTPMDAREIVNEIVLSALTGERLLLANHNLHSLYLFQKHEDVRTFYGMADRTVIDGAPILWMASRKDRKLDASHRVGSTDWLAQLLPVAEEANLRVAFVGGEPGVASLACVEIQRRFPALRIFSRDGFFDPTCGGSENEAVLRWIDNVKPDVLLVGMGMPRQERWISENYSSLRATVVCSVGGCFDYIAGSQRLAPRWTGRLGLEWAYRLCCDPVRLWRRYLVEPQAIVVRLMLRRIRRRRS